MPASVLKVGIVSDCQYAEVDTETKPLSSSRQRYTTLMMSRYYRQSIIKLEAAVQEFIQQRVDAIINLGDLVDRDPDRIDGLMEIMRTARVPIWSVAGNHDFTGSSTSPQEVYKSLGMNSPYYQIRRPPFRLLFLDSNELSGLKYPEGSRELRDGRALIASMRKAGATNAFDWNGGLGEKQLAWLNQQVNNACLNAESVVLISHHPFFPDSTHAMLNAPEIQDLVRNSPNIVLSISGHKHDGDFVLLNNSLCVTLRGMVERQANSFGVLDMSPTQLLFQGFGLERSWRHRIGLNLL